MDGNNDRTLDFLERKRFHDEVTPEQTGRADLESLVESKRLKFSQVKPQSGDDLVHLRNRENTSARTRVEVRESDSRDEQPVDSSAQNAHRVKNLAGTAPSINWNAGSKANIRISFGRKTSKSENHGVTSLEEKPAGSKPRESQIEEKLASATSINTLLSSPHHLVPTNDKLNQVSELYFSDTNARDQNNQEDRRPKRINSTDGEHMNSSSTKLPPTSNNTTASIENFRDGRSESEEPYLQTESDSGIKLKPDTSGDESGEISGSELRASASRRTSKISKEANLAKDNTRRSGSTDGDAMLIYSNSHPTTKVTGNKNPQPVNRDSDRRIPTLLSDLSPADLKLQLRYFYMTKTPDTVEPSNPVRCLVCAREGHMAEACSSLTCAVCGKFNHHFTKDCAQVQRCWKCRERGHEALNCPRKVIPPNFNSVICELCERTGHLENDCELIWRTSGRPWETDFRKRSVRLGCYECGRSGHLGNDCSSRMPGKRLGTSSWSLNDTRRPPEDSEDGGITIKGRATQQRPTKPDDSDDDTANFLRPKIPGPIRKGQIQIASQSFRQHPPPTSASGNHHHHHHNLYPSWEDRRDERISSNNRDHYNSHPTSHRSISPPPPPPPYPGRRSDFYRNPHFNQPPPSAPARPAIVIRPNNWDVNHHHLPARPNWPPGPSTTTSSSSTYRPMPSAARDAWIRHRT